MGLAFLGLGEPGELLPEGERYLRAKHAIAYQSSGMGSRITPVRAHGCL
jgi:hypothetical protein